jgi:hypothetical protein
LAKIADHGKTAVVACERISHGPRIIARLTFMRAWPKKDGRWQIIVAAIAPVSAK